MAYTEATKPAERPEWEQITGFILESGRKAWEVYGQYTMGKTQAEIDEIEAEAKVLQAQIAAGTLKLEEAKFRLAEAMGLKPIGYEAPKFMEQPWFWPAVIGGGVLLLVLVLKR